ncbi:cyclic nucleotide-binding domain-containing protein [Amphritea sp. HPY]|uniref:cyclic nucleotide-binding domain-containing protein n=1 Tax=Amphritea sp. HPY TaxID=3421652 RepID=UPI003D7CEEEE
MNTLQPEQVIADLTLRYLRELATFGAISDAAIIDLISRGTVKSLHKGEVLSSYDMPVTGFAIVLQGNIAFYKHCKGKDVLTRHFRAGEQIGFDTMIGMIANSGTEIGYEDSLVLQVSSVQFFDLHQDFPADFGLLMINLSRELAREIAMLEEVIGKSVGWSAE